MSIPAVPPTSPDRRPRRALVVTVAVAALLVLGACTGQGGGPPDGYNAGLKDDFVESCTGAGGGDADLCGCAYDEIEENVSFEDYKAITDRLRDDPGELPAEFVRAYTDCEVG